MKVPKQNHATFSNSLIQIRLSTNDERVTSLLTEIMPRNEAMSSDFISATFDIQVEESDPLADISFYYANRTRESGVVESYLGRSLAKVRVNISRSEVSAVVHHWEPQLISRLKQSLFIDPMIKLLSGTGFHFLHSALVAKNQNCVLICGPSGTGKSTLSLMLALKGNELITDDKCLFKRKNDAFIFFNFTQQIGVQPHMWAAFPELHRFPTTLDSDKKRKRIDPAAFLRRQRGPHCLNPKALLFPQYCERSEVKLSPLSPHEAIDLIRKDDINSYNAGHSLKTASENFFAIHEITSQIPSYRITYSDSEISKIPALIDPLLA